MTQQPVVSIVTPSYNQAEFLEETMLSVLNQGYPNIEYIVIDGGSSDGSVDIIRRYTDRLAYWVSEPDRGQAHALQKGFTHASGEIIAFLNSDDAYLPGAVDTAVGALLADPELAMVHGDSICVDGDGRQIGWQQVELEREAPTVAVDFVNSLDVLLGYSEFLVYLLEQQILAHSLDLADPLIIGWYL